MRNLVDDPAYVGAKVALRKALYDQLADRTGRHVIPYTQRTSIGAVRRNRQGTGAAPFLDKWLVEPNRLDRMDDMIPDGKWKEDAHRAGRPFFPAPVLGAEKAPEDGGK